MGNKREWEDEYSQIIYTHYAHVITKMIPVETVPG
jgi:hypothetical protein